MCFEERDALQMAVAARKPARGTIHHSDHGGQFVGLTFGQACHDAGISRSMGAVGTCYDTQSKLLLSESTGPL
jgi:transposase InsO family protein